LWLAGGGIVAEDGRAAGWLGIRAVLVVLAWLERERWMGSAGVRRLGGLDLMGDAC
jgi:hypothetical protein